MKPTKKTFALNNIIYVTVYAIIGILVINKGAVYLPDSYTFLDMALNHSPVYCVFLKIFTGVFGTNFEVPVIIAQYIIVAFGVNFFIKTLKDVFSLHYVGFLFLQLVCLAPCIYIHFIGSALLSEAITYPIFLVIFALTLKMFIENNLLYIYKISVLLYIIVLTRGQFLALVLALFLIVGYIIFKGKTLKKDFYFLIILLVIPLLTSFSEKVYNKVVFGYFINNTMNYVHFISSPFYIADKNDLNLFTDEDQRNYFAIVYYSLKEAKLTRNQNLYGQTDDYFFFQQNFPKICNRRVYDLGLDYFKSKGLNYIEQNIALNALCSKMLVPLVKQNFRVWVKLSIKNFKNSFGSSKQMLFFIVLFLYGVFNLKKLDNDIFKFIVIATLFMFANNTLIALVVHSIKRYIFYFDWVIFATFVIIINEIFKYQRIRES